MVNIALPADSDGLSLGESFSVDAEECNAWLTKYTGGACISTVNDTHYSYRCAHTNHALEFGMIWRVRLLLTAYLKVLVVDHRT